jgi:hypothetical protein
MPIFTSTIGINPTKMDGLTYKSKISQTFENVREFSFEEKKKASVYDEAKINKLLDKILELKKIFADKTVKINGVIEKIEQLTWFTDLDSELLKSINDLISSIRDLHSSLKRQYVALNGIRSKGIAKEEIKNFKAAMDDLKEVASDLESRFFFLPNISDFEETTKELSLV